MHWTHERLDSYAAACSSAGLGRSPAGTAGVAVRVWCPETAMTKQGGPMKLALTLMAVVLVVVSLTVPALAQDKLGKVSFPTSCDAAVQGEFERGVAMLHSYW